MITIAEYVWLDCNQRFRSKSKIFFNVNSLETINGEITASSFPVWNYDGSSTGQASGQASEVRLIPVAIFNDPFRIKFGTKNYLVLCECRDITNNPVQSNTRSVASKIFNNPLVANEEPWYGIEQEYVLYDNKTKRPLGWPICGEPKPQGNYYCGVGAGNVFGRNIVELHYRYCLEAGIKIDGINAEVMPGQWEFQIGPCIGINCADNLIVARYILERICEDYDVYVSYNPKPEIGDWNGSGMHTNYSSKSMRDLNGIKHILDAMKKLESKHSLHIANYGDNSKRLTGTHETSNANEFTFGVGLRTTSVRIPTAVFDDDKGYFEDRRPASDADPYIVTKLLAETIHLSDLD